MHQLRSSLYAVIKEAVPSAIRQESATSKHESHATRRNDCRVSISSASGRVDNQQRRHRNPEQPKAVSIPSALNNVVGRNQRYQPPRVRCKKPVYDNAFWGTALQWNQTL